MRWYECPHVVSFNDTNLFGNVYFARFVEWQGRCRELFLRDHAPAILEQFREGLVLVTTKVSCEYLTELAVFDEVIIRMRIASLALNRVGMHFEYWRRTGHTNELVARGHQEVAAVRRAGGRIIGVPLPNELAVALEQFSNAGNAV